MDIFTTVLKATVLLLCLIAAFEDVRHLRIRNDFCLAILVLFLPMPFVIGLSETVPHLISGVIVLVVTAALFFFRMFGGGDSKLLAVLALWYTPAQLPPFLMLMSLFGGALALLALLFKKTSILSKIEPRFPKLIGDDDGWLKSLMRGETVVPYGVAITLAAALTIF
ncbi:MAG: prepilin peptidase [Alphaproteobacteria bacterium]|nr:prepilin peptidase [Alphaproteobacteria bacterium]